MPLCPLQGFYSEAARIQIKPCHRSTALVSCCHFCIVISDKMLHCMRRRIDWYEVRLLCEVPGARQGSAHREGFVRICFHHLWLLKMTLLETLEAESSCLVHLYITKDACIFCFDTELT